MISSGFCVTYSNLPIMASATGIPQDHPATIEAREDEPLLGRPGDVMLIRRQVREKGRQRERGRWPITLASLCFFNTLTCSSREYADVARTSLRSTITNNPKVIRTL
jgi:hypothetical protein